MREIAGFRIGVAALLLVFSAAAAPSGDATARLAPAIGNAIVSTHPDGRKAKLWLRRDGTYAAEGRAGERSGCAWKVKDQKLCLSQRSPFPIPIAYCKPIPAEAVGKPWRDKAVNGDQVTNEIVTGGAG
jgi:hypothetical protein